MTKPRSDVIPKPYSARLRDVTVAGGRNRVTDRHVEQPERRHTACDGCLAVPHTMPALPPIGEADIDVNGLDFSGKQHARRPEKRAVVDFDQFVRSRNC